MTSVLRIFTLYLIIIEISCTSLEEFDFEQQIPENCTCVPYFQCSEETGKIITDGTGLFNVRHFDKNDSCIGYFDVCCDASGIQASTEVDGDFSFATSNLPDDNSHTLPGQGCGYQYPGSFPWSGALLNRDTNLGQIRYKCAVSLIHSQVVLTAAHCLETKEIKPNWMIRVGHMSREAKQIIPHPNYNDGSLHNDIALIILSSPVQLSAKVNPICIPSVGVRLDNTKCTVSVWAKDTTYLKMVNIPIVGREKCLKQLRRTRLGGYFQLHRSFTCAGGEDFKDTCGGDGGSPLVCPVANQPGRYHQAGIVSWGIGCGEDNVPGVYVNLPIFRDWIDQVLLKNRLDITDYRY